MGTTSIQPESRGGRPHDWWRQSRAINFFSSHLQKYVAYIHLPITRKSNSSCCDQVYTGFLASYRGFDIWVTAGHVIEEMRKIKSDSDFSLGTVSLIDGGTGDTMAIPLCLDAVVLDGADHAGIDIGFIWLRKMYSDLIRANPAMAFVEQHMWYRGDDDLDPDGHYLAGAPHSWNEVKRSIVGPATQRVQFRCPVVCAPVEVMPDRGKQNELDVFWGAPGALYGSIERLVETDGRVLENIAGMSGGPMFSVRSVDERTVKYHLVAIQSAWLAESRIVRATPSAFIAPWLDGRIAEIERRRAGRSRD